MSGLPLFTELAGKSVLGNPGDDFVKRAGNQPSPFLFSSLFPCKSRDYSGALGRTRTCDLLIRSDRVSDPIDLHWSPFTGFSWEAMSLSPYEPSWTSTHKW